MDSNNHKRLQEIQANGSSVVAAQPSKMPMEDRVEFYFNQHD
jgi:hypothetical protein